MLLFVTAEHYSLLPVYLLSAGSPFSKVISQHGLFGAKLPPAVSTPPPTMHLASLLWDAKSFVIAWLLNHHKLFKRVVSQAIMGMQQQRVLFPGFCLVQTSKERRLSKPKQLATPLI